MLQSIFLHGVALLSSTVLASFFGVTHPSYFGYMFGNGSNRLEKVKMGHYFGNSAATAVRQARMMCNRRCAHHEDCWSNYVYYQGVYIYCILVNVNSCKIPRSPVNVIESSVNYDKIQDMSPPTSCRSDCLRETSGSCDACDRPTCRTSDCTVCDYTCLDCFSNIHPNLSLSSEITCHLWGGTNDFYQFDVTCLGEKFLVFRRSSWPNQKDSQLPFDENFSFDLRRRFRRTVGNLYIELRTLDTPSESNSSTTIFTATYSDFYIDRSHKLSLGPFINGTAGDGLYSPLSSVSFVTNTTLFDTSCGNFWNISGTLNLTEPTPYGVGPCPGLGTAFWGKPNMSEANAFQSGITWSALPNYTIVEISIWLT